MKSIYFDPIPHIYPDSRKLDIREVTPPEDLKTLIDQTRKVKRFDDLKYHIEGMIVDNTKAHTIRCVYRARTIPYKSRILERMLWIHDIPEMVDVKDASAVERYANPGVARQVEAAEKRFAKSIFNKEDFYLYKQFQTAENFIMDASRKCPEMQEALVAKTIDVVDGNLIFVYFFAKWLLKNEYDGKRPTEGSFLFPLSVFKRTEKKLAKCAGLDPITRRTLKFLSKEGFKATISMYEEVPQNKIPVVVREQLDLMRKIK